MNYHNILDDYVRNHAVSSMLKLGWTYKAAKSYGWKHAARGPEYHVDQPLLTHILNGLFAGTRIIEFLKAHRYYRMSERDFKLFLVLYTYHDAYKDRDLAQRRTGKSEFSVPLSALEELIERMGLRDFIDISAADLRAAMVALLSPKVADLSSGTPGISHIATFIHLADALASQQTARDYTTAENRLREMSRYGAVAVRQDMRMSKRLGISAQPQQALPELQFYYHELDDYRGLSTLLIHQTTEEVLAPLGLYPTLYFANAILYVGPKDVSVDTAALRQTIAATLFNKIRQEVGEESYTIAKEACDPRKGMKIEKYAYLFCSFDQMLHAVQEQTPLSKTSGFLKKVLANRLSKKKYTHLEEFYTLYVLPRDADENEAHAQRWWATSKLVMAAENMAASLVPGDTLEWLFTVFKTPTQIAQTVRQNMAKLKDGGVSDHSFVIAYHWLIATSFPPTSRTWLEIEAVDIQEAAIAHILSFLKQYDKTEDLIEFVEKELGIQSDVKKYLSSTLIFSFEQARLIDASPLEEYSKERKQSHKRLCVMCNRLITDQIPKKNSEIKTTIADQQALVFSNKLMPSRKVNSMMVWCPMCYLEFMLRKLSGQSYPQGSDYNASYRLHLYVLPDYSFTPQLWEYSSQQLLRNFHPKETVVSRLTLRGSHEEPGLPARWLRQHTINQEWLEEVGDMFANQAAHMKMPTKEGKQRGKQGDRITFSFKNPNYMLTTYDTVVAKQAEKSLAPTHIEVWAKALYAALLIHLLTGTRVYITDKPYLSITRPEQMKTIIEMEGLHPLLHGLMPMRRTDTASSDGDVRASEGSARLPIAAVPVMLDLFSAVWEINAGLYRSRPGERHNLDKQIASILEEVNTNYLAGAAFYKMRERDKASAYATFTYACQLLLPRQGDQADVARQILYEGGYELMIDKKGGVLMNLAEKITDASLLLYHPSLREAGRAHRFETLFRTGVEAIKSNTRSSEDDAELIAKVAGTILKRVGHLEDGGGFTPTYGKTRLEATQIFATILVQDLFRMVYGSSVSKLTHEENRMANAIYFLTFQKVTLYWDERKKQSANQTKEKAPDKEAPGDEL